MPSLIEIFVSVLGGCCQYLPWKWTGWWFPKMEEHDQVHEDNTDNGDSKGGDEEDKVEC